MCIVSNMWEGSWMIYLQAGVSKKLHKVLTIRWFIFHFVPVCLGVYLAFEGWVLANNKEIQEAREYFTKLSEQIVLSVQLSSTITQMQPEALVALYFSDEVPLKSQFERFTIGNPFWDSAGTINGIRWAPYILDKDRAGFEADTKRLYPAFKIWRFGPANSQVEQMNSSFNFYCPILYNPGGEVMIGFDICNDIIQGPIIRRVASTGIIESVKPFELRMPPTLDEGVFPVGTIVYMPLFRNKEEMIQIQYTDDYIGCVIAVIHFRSMLTSILQKMQLQDVDVFMFTDNVEPKYMTHFEGYPANNLTYDSIKDIRVSDIVGDMVTTAVDAQFVTFVDTRYMIIVRARKGKFLRRYETNLPVNFLLISLFVLFLDKIMMLAEKILYRRQRRVAEGKDSKCGLDTTVLNGVSPTECNYANARVFPSLPVAVVEILSNPASGSGNA